MVSPARAPVIQADDEITVSVLPKSARPTSISRACTRIQPVPELAVEPKRLANDVAEFVSANNNRLDCSSDQTKQQFHSMLPNIISNKIFQPNDNNSGIINNDTNNNFHNNSKETKTDDTKLIDAPSRQRESESCTVVKATEWHKDKEEDYTMTAKCRGICLIINNVSFEMDIFSKRKGSDMDAFRFKNIFKELGFEVECKRNMTADKMKSCFKQTAALCMARHNALIVILLSHGTESGIMGTDNVEVDLNDILTHFDNKNCKQMIGKPKVFIIQACRGRQADYGVREAQTFFSQPDSQVPTSQLTQFNSQSPMFTRIPRWTEVDSEFCPTRTDMALCFSSHTGFLSTRNEEDGSWLGASLALHLKREAYRRHLIEIFNMVSRDVRRRRSSDGYKQVLEITTIGFDKNLYFNPGLYTD